MSKKEDIVIEDEFDEEQSKKKNKKEKSPNKIVENFKMYKFIIKVIVFAILVSLGIFIIIKKQEAIGIVYMATGILCAFLAIIRFVPLFRTLKTTRAKILSFIEICIHLVIGIYLIAAAFVHWDAVEQFTGSDILSEKLANTFAGFNLNAYKYIVVIIFYTRALCHFWCVDLYNEASNRINFYLHAICMTLAVVIALLPLSPETIVWTLVVLCFVSAAVIAGEAGSGYFRYRKALTTVKQKDKNVKKEKEKDIAPSVDEEKEIIVPNQDDNRDSSIVS